MVLSKILSHPLMQLFSFCFILVGSAYFGGPYIWFLYHAAQEIGSYAVFGCMAVVITLVSVFMSGYGRAVMQFIGACLMTLSLLVFFFSSENFMNMYVYRQVLPLLTLALFVGVMVFVVRKFVKEKKI